MKAPGLDERADCDVERSRRLLMDLLSQDEEFEEVSLEYHRLLTCPRIQPANLALLAIDGKLVLHPIDDVQGLRGGLGGVWRGHRENDLESCRHRPPAESHHHRLLRGR